MKKIITSLTLVLIALIGSSFFIYKSSNGIQGYAGSPGEGTCTSCHGGGASASSGITITAVPAFSVNINSDTEYMPDSLYQISIAVSATGFTKYGFASEILNVTATNAGTLQTQGTGVKFLNSGAKRTATHTTAKTGTLALFTYKWRAPSSGDAIVYAVGNAVNGNGSTSGDFVISPVSLNLVAAPIPLDTTSNQNLTNLKENQISSVSRVSVFPNPANDFCNMSYYLKDSREIRIELISLNGNVIKILHKEIEDPGFYSQILDLQNVDPGAYFIKTSANDQMVSQKLIIIP